MSRRVFFAGMLIALCTATSFSRANDKPALTPIEPMTVTRAAHSATLLEDGTVLIAGGIAGDQVILDSAEIYDPTTNRFTLTGSLNDKRTDQTATLLSNGDVLIAGGYGDGWLASAELYDPSKRLFTPTGSMSVARDGFTATRLNDGRVLMIGGYDHSYRKVHASAELYDPATGTFSRTGNLNVGRASHTATLLSDGRVLVVGGKSNSGLLASAELYDPASGTFTLTGSMSVVRYKHAAVLPPDGNVLVMGGSNEQDEFGRYASAELYDPTTGVFSPAGDMQSPRYKFLDAVTLLQNGTVLIAGGGIPIELYDPALDKFMSSNGELDTERFYSTATLLSNGDVLIAGGYDDRIQATAKAWVYEAGG